MIGCRAMCRWWMKDGRWQILLGSLVVGAVQKQGGSSVQDIDGGIVGRDADKLKHIFRRFKSTLAVACILGLVCLILSGIRRRIVLVILVEPLRLGVQQGQSRVVAGSEVVQEMLG